MDSINSLTAYAVLFIISTSSLIPALAMMPPGWSNTVPKIRPILDAILREHPDNVGALIAQGELSQLLHQNTSRWYEKALALDPENVTALIDYSLDLIENQKYDKALNTLNKSLLINPNNTKANILMGNILVNLGRFPQAIASYDRALSIDPYDITAMTEKGNALAAEGKNDEGMNVLNRALSIAPEGVNSKNIWTWLGKAHILANSGIYDGAISIYDNIIAIDHYSSAVHAKAELLKSMGKDQEAKKIEEQYYVPGGPSELEAVEYLDEFGGKIFLRIFACAYVKDVSSYC